MVVRLRLARHGTRNNPFYHLVAINDSKPRDARPIEKLGEYDPIPRPVPVRPAPRPMLHAGKGKEKEVPQVMTSGLASEMRLEKRIEWNSARIRHWLERGAQPSKPVARLLDRVSAWSITSARDQHASSRDFCPSREQGGRSAQR